MVESYVDVGDWHAHDWYAHLATIVAGGVRSGGNYTPAQFDAAFAAVGPVLP